MIVIRLAKSVASVDLLSITRIPRPLAMAMALTMFTLSWMGSRIPFTVATVSGMQSSEAISPRYSRWISARRPSDSWEVRRPSFSPSVR